MGTSGGNVPVFQAGEVGGKATAIVGDKSGPHVLLESDGSGVQVIQALRNHQPSAVPVVVTIHDDDEHLFPALQAGAFGYLLKSVDPQRLRDAIKEAYHGGSPISGSVAPIGA